MPQPATEVALSAVSYLRVSTKDQASRGGLAEGLSIPAQRSAIAAKARTIGAEIVMEFADAGESGRSTDRPQLQEMLRYLRNNHVDLVIVHKIDRLARNRADDVTINLAIRQAGAQLVSVTENVDESPQGQLIHGIFSAVADFYSANLAQEVLKGMEQKVRGGGTIGRAPVGYINIRTTINGREARQVAIDPERADHVRWAFDTYATNPDMTLSRLTTLLHDRGLTIRATANQAERPLQRSQVHKMLTRRFYVGYTTLRGVEYPGNHQALIDERTFQQVQDRLATNRGTGNRERKHLQYLAGSLYCGRCRSRLVYTINRGRHGGLYEYYACTGRQSKKTDCDAPHFAVARIEDAVALVWDAEHAAWQTQSIPAIHEELVQYLRALREESGRNTRLIRHRIDKIQRDRHKWAENAIDGIVPADIARDKQAQLARQLASLTTELASLEAAGIDTEATLNQLIDQISDPGRAYRRLDDGLRRTYNQAWFSRIYIDVVPNNPDSPLRTNTDRTVISQSLETCRQILLAAQNNPADPEGPAEIIDIGSRRTRGSIKNPLVELRGLEPLTPTLPVWCATSCAIAPFVVLNEVTPQGPSNPKRQLRAVHRRNRGPVGGPGCAPLTPTVGSPGRRPTPPPRRA